MLGDHEVVAAAPDTVIDESHLRRDERAANGPASP